MSKFYYGGQAVLEGVMMRGQRHMAVAVRAPDGRIVVHEEALKGALYRHPAMKLPFLRGFVALWDALGLGMKSLMFSANVALEEEASVKKAEGNEQKAPGSGQTAGDVYIDVDVTQEADSNAVNPHSALRTPHSEMGRAAWASIAIALVFMVGIFFVLPVLAANVITSVASTDSSLTHNLIEGAIRLALFIGYIWAIGFMPDIKRVFGYHGAEHKTINAYEAGAPLVPERVQSFTLLNPRCGTTFLLIVLLLATLLFVLLGKPPFILLVLSRIVLVPVVAAIGYEFIRLMANLYHVPIVRAIMAPGIALQKMTTRPPDLSMIEVGIAALQRVLVADGVVAREREEIEEPVPTLA
ncbi:MAG TPA: DUF1385 domain-containing protein [Chloroflexia bacterium]|nr:DUF1385 domain-containing protein [Chloroflexia bacterium]